MAWRKSSRPTMSSVIAWRDGISKALMKPSPKARTMISHTCTTWASVSTASNMACAIDRLCVQISMRLRSTRSAITPPNDAMKNTVTWAQNEVSPSRNGEWVRL